MLFELAALGPVCPAGFDWLKIHFPIYARLKKSVAQRRPFGHYRNGTEGKV